MSNSKLLKRTFRWIIRIVVTLVILTGLGIGFVYYSSFRLEPWEYAAIERTEQSPEKPNILLLVAEDLSLRIHTFGDSLALTPNLDKLASEGVRYPNVFTTAGVCAPSRAALITGMYQISMGGQHMRTGSRPEGGYYCVPPPEVKAFPELLRAAGYYTFNIAKEDYQFSGMRTGTGPFTIWDAEDDNQLWRSRRDGQPFFGMINFMETHETGLFSPLGHMPHSIVHFMIQLLRPAMVLNTNGMTPATNKIKLPPYYPDTPVVRADLARFYANINAMDAVVGDIIERLKKDGLDKSTIVIWTTDHGDCLPRAKRDLTDSGLKVPMIIYWPEGYRPEGVKPRTVDMRLISFVDLAPTILDIAGVPKPSWLQGVDFRSDSTKRQYIFAARDRIDEVYGRQRAVRDEQFKYIRSWYPEQPDGVHIKFRDNIEMMREMWRLRDDGKLNKDQLKWFEPAGSERLFDLEKDPYELHNVANDTAYADVLMRMRKALDDWLGSIEDWSDIHENEMVKRFEPNGYREKTPPPTIETEGKLVKIHAPAKGASIGYRIGKGPWLLYTKPFEVHEKTTISAKAVRYGWEESKVAKTKL